MAIPSFKSHVLLSTLTWPRYPKQVIKCSQDSFKKKGELNNLKCHSVFPIYTNPQVAGHVKGKISQSTITF